jgi:hypothetical protein
MLIRRVREGIGATHHLDHGVAWNPEDVGPHPSNRKRPRRRPRRAEPPEQSEADVIAADACAREAAALHADPTRIEECGRWGDQEVGKMIRLFRAGAMVQDIATAIGEPLQVVSYELTHIRMDLVARSDGRVLEPTPGGGAKGKRLSEGQVARIVEMRRCGQTIRIIARELGVAESTVRYVIDREGGE